MTPAKLKAMAESISRNGFAPGHTGTLYAPVSMVVNMLGEAGRITDAMRMKAEAGANDIVRISGGQMELIDVGPEEPDP